MTATVFPRRRGLFAETLGYLWVMATPFKRRSAADVYDLLDTRAFTDNGLYLNLGYWKEATTIDSACLAMAKLVAEKAELNPDDRVLDAGFGFADQDLYWMETFRPKKIVGINITKNQVDLARRRVLALRLEDRIELFEGSATETGLPSGSFDKITALESAFHFDTREMFFREAHRLLRPGGRLVLADLVPRVRAQKPLDRFIQSLCWRSAAASGAFEANNLYDQSVYRQKLAQAGFQNFSIESIWEHVFPPLHRYLSTPGFLDRFHFLCRPAMRFRLRLDSHPRFSPFDYVIVQATR